MARFWLLQVVYVSWWDFKTFGCSWQSDFRLLANWEVTLSCGAHILRSVSASRKAKRCKCWSKKPKDQQMLKQKVICQ